MLISVAELLKHDNSEEKFSLAVDLSSFSFAPMSVHFAEPIKVVGKMKHAGGVIMLEAEAEGNYTCVCDRCGVDTTHSIKFSVSENYVRAATVFQEDEDAVRFEGYEIDLAQTVSEFAFSALPTKHLCKDDCKGLCTVCGKNLNMESCTCKDDEWDPRFEALRGLFD